jgi:protein TonB
MLLHVVIMLVVPNFSFKPIKPVKEQALEIELVQPPPPAPVPEVTPEPPPPQEPEPIKPEPVVKPNKPTPVKQTPESTPEIAPTTEKSVEATPPPPDVIKVAPTAETKPVQIAPPPPPPETPEASGPSEAEIDAARNAYRNQVQKELKRNQRYPRIAEQRSIQGEVKLEISLDQEGNVVDVQVAESSGNEALDEAAKKAVRQSNLKQHMTKILRGQIDKITVTVGFKLAE